MSYPTEKQQELARKLAERFPDAAIAHDAGGLPTIRAAREQYVEIVTALRDEPAFGFTILSHVAGVHWPDDPEPFEVVARLTSMSLAAQVAVRVRAAGDPPTVPSLAAFWQAANWHEREVFDMFGVRFDGHPDPRRIFLEEDATFHPLRKEYPVEGTDE
jgi:NADH-quinone oxidoreductase subunit C